VSDSNRENRLQIEHHQEQDRMQFRYIEKLSATLCLALLFISGFAHADDNSLIKEANAALSQKDYSAAFSKFSVLAQRGNLSAQFNLGAFYLNGQGVQRDEKKAYEWFAKSAVQGDARALRVLQNAAAKGNESAKNELNKIQQQTASRQTQPSGQSQQASSVPVKGKSLLEEANAALAQKDYSEAFPKFLALAQQGNASAQFNVGVFFLNGQGVQKDQKQAYDWFAKSAAQGCSCCTSHARRSSESQSQSRSTSRSTSQSQSQSTSTNQS
jgi:TPR repeat protein